MSRIRIALFMWLGVLLMGCETAPPRAIVWDFQKAETGWHPRAETIAVARAEGVGAEGLFKSSLHIHGKSDVGWNYAISDSHPMTPGQLYRLSAWVRVDRLGKNTPAPYLKCEFVPEDGKGSLGRVDTEHYDDRKLGTWQRLAGEFKAPDGVGTCWVALEKGGSGPMEIAAYLDHVMIEPIERFTYFDKFDLVPMPRPLQKAQGIHPRIYLTGKRIAELKEAMKTTHAGIWKEIQAQADSCVKHGAPKYREDDGWSGHEQLWQREVGNAMPNLAMAYVLTGERKYLDSAREWALASCGYKTWGLGTVDGMDLSTGHQLFGLGIVYDWCYDDLDEQARTTIRDTIIRRGTVVFEAAATNRAWWRRSYMQNHLWVNVCGLSIAGLAICDEHEDARKWVGFALDKFKRSMEALGPDGASHEGAGYWEYGVEYLLKFMHVARQLLDVDMYDNAWWKNTAAYDQYLALPHQAWAPRNSIVDIADCPRSHWYGPDHLLRALAAEYRDGHAQWLAQEIDDANIDAPSARWLNMIWYDPTVEPKHPRDLPTMRHFADMEIVSARTDWSGGESLVVFKCGPFIGHKGVQEFDYDPGGGHVHPDANHFVIFGCGEWLIRDDGYRKKWTGQHNTLLIDGKGQLNEGSMWANNGTLLKLKARPRVIKATSTAALDHFAGDGTESYPRDIGLKHYIRHLLFLKPDVLIVLDDIALDEARDLEVRFHPEQPKATRDGNAFTMTGKGAALRLEILTPRDIKVVAEDVKGEDREGHKDRKDKDWSMFTIRPMTKRAHWQNAVALSWSKADAKPARVQLQTDGDNWRFTADGRTVTFDWKTGEAN
ncbi:MAG: DUF4962 domain-containing protein [Planctomycetota bacterium]